MGRVLAIILGLAACAGVAAVVYAALGNTTVVGHLLESHSDSPISSAPRRVTFTVRPGQSAGTIGDGLQQNGLIRSSLTFRLKVESRGVAGKIEAGEYELSPSMSTSDIVAALSRGAARGGATLTVVEGWRVEQVALRIEELGLAPADDVLRLVRSPREYGLALPDPSATSLEGYLFPDTYELEPAASPLQIVEIMLRQFDRRFGESLRRRAADRGLPLAQAVTLASIVEREAVHSEERPLIASVYLNRLAAGMRLEADPTVQYAVADVEARGALSSRRLWKRELTQQDLVLDSPYNTYRFAGLPPGPICSPGFDSLQAAVAPAETAYLYFVARGGGYHAFAETPERHQANVEKYRDR
jgi:UPF0755 protein